MDRFPKKESHRGLVLIAKTLQNLANGVKFGVKEAHMDPLNATLGKYDTQYAPGTFLFSSFLIVLK